MKNEDINELGNEQLEEVTGGKWDENRNCSYEDGEIKEMRKRTALVKFDFGQTYECGFGDPLGTGLGLEVGARVRVQMMPRRIIYRRLD